MKIRRVQCERSSWRTELGMNCARERCRSILWIKTFRNEYDVGQRGRKIGNLDEEARVVRLVHDQGMDHATAREGRMQGGT